MDLKVGVANNISSPAAFGVINARNYDGTKGSAIESKKALVSLLTLTAPDSWGSLKGSALYAGLDYGPGDGLNQGGTHLVDKTHLYVGAVVMTPVTGLKFGAAWDSVNNSDLGTLAKGAAVKEGYAGTFAGYVSYKITDKMTINGRGEYAYGSAFDNLVPPSTAQEAKILAATATLQYRLVG